jgi:hypothetical protein
MDFSMQSILDALKGTEQVQEAKVDKPYLQPTPEEAAFLRQISQIESTAGQNVDHQELKHGIQRGTAAVGRYGLMPNSIQELVKRGEMAHEDAPAIQKLKGLDALTAAQVVKSDPALEDEMAVRMKRLIETRPGIKTPEQVNYMWQYGHNLNADKLNERNYMQAPRTLQFQKIRQTIK